MKGTPFSRWEYNDQLTWQGILRVKCAYSPIMGHRQGCSPVSQATISNRENYKSDWSGPWRSVRWLPIRPRIGKRSLALVLPVSLLNFEQRTKLIGTRNLIQRSGRISSTFPPLLWGARRENTAVASRHGSGICAGRTKFHQPRTTLRWRMWPLLPD